MKTKLFMFLAGTLVVVPFYFFGAGRQGSPERCNTMRRSFFTETHKYHTCHSVPADEIESNWLGSLEAQE